MNRKTILLMAMAAFIANGICGQNLLFDWAGRFGCPDWDGVSGMTIDNAGNIYVIGYLTQSGDFDPGPGVVTLTAVNDGYGDAYVLKFTNTCNLVWARRIGAAGYQRFYGVAVDNSGNVALSGYFEQTVDMDPGAGTFNLSASGEDAFVLYLNSQGNFVWANKLGGFSDDRAYDVKFDGASNLIVVGEFQGTADFNPGPVYYPITSTSIEDMFVWKLSSSGALVSAFTFGGQGDDHIFQLEIDSNGNLYFVGRTYATVDFDPGPGVVNLTGGGVVFSMTPGGALRYAINAAGTPSEIAIAPNNEALIAGTFVGTFDFDPGAGVLNLSTTPQIADAYVFRLDSMAGFEWAVSFGSLTTGDNLWGLEVDDSGAVYCTGAFYSTVDFDPGPGVFNLNNTAYADVFVSKLDPQGAFRFARKIGSSQPEWGYALAVDDDFNLFGVGDFQGTCDFDPTGNLFYMTPLSSVSDGYMFKWRQCFPTSFVITDTACSTYSLNGQTYSNSGTYTQVWINARGCDSTITLNLTLQGTDSTILRNVCDTTLTVNGQTYITSGTYTQTLTNSVGCDSILTIVADIDSSTSGNIAVDACNGYIFMGGFLTASGQYVYNLTNSQGCDSTLTLDLTIHHPTTDTMLDSACVSYSINGNTYTSSGTYFVQFSDVWGCDSTVTLFLTITPLSPLTVHNGGTISAVQSGATYQWVNCSGMVPVPGATNQSFTPTISGNYAVILSNGSCRDTSACTIVVHADDPVNDAIYAYPNPSLGEVTIEFGSMTSEATIEVFNALGQSCGLYRVVNAQSAQLRLPAAAGLYLLEVKTPIGKKTLRMVRE